MNMEQVSMADVLSGLAVDGLLNAGERDTAIGVLSAASDEAQPWYVRTMVGVSAWFASLLLVSFVAGTSLVAGGEGLSIVGMIAILGALLLRNRMDNDFSNQAALAVNLAGQGLFAFGIAESGGGDEVELTLSATILVNALLIPFYRDRIYRGIAVLLMIGALVGLLYSWQRQDLLAFLAPLLGGLLVWLVFRENRIIVLGWDHLVRPLTVGLLIGTYGITLLSALYLWPELTHRFHFYPNPWISTVGFGVLLLLTEVLLMGKVFGGSRTSRTYGIYGLTLLVLIATLPAPGIALSVLILVLGTARCDPFLQGAGIAFLALFAGAWFYGMETSLLVKSYTLVAGGLLVLFGRWLLSSTERTDRGGPNHA